jgi:hypothetical protein
VTIAEQAKLLKATLDSWAQTLGASVGVAKDPVDLVNILRTRPGAPTVAILFTDEEPRTDFDELGRVDRTFKLVLSRGQGFSLDTGAALTDGTAGGQPMFDLVEQARELIRAARFPEAEPRPYYKGASQFEVQGFILDAYELRFALGTQIPIYAE